MKTKRYIMIQKFIMMSFDQTKENPSMKKIIKYVTELGKNYDIKPNEVLEVLDIPSIVLLSPTRKKIWGIIDED